jgi:hypothetical protein
MQNFPAFTHTSAMPIESLIGIRLAPGFTLVELRSHSQAQSHFGRQLEFPMAGVKILNIEAGMPTVEEARQILLAELKQAKQSGVAAVKIIHGYGSTGKGGALRGALRTSLLRRKKEGLVTRVIFGEKWSVFGDDARYAIEHCPDLRSDRDLNHSNEGITIAVLV